MVLDGSGDVNNVRDGILEKYRADLVEDQSIDAVSGELEGQTGAAALQNPKASHYSVQMGYPASFNRRGLEC